MAPSANPGDFKQLFRHMAAIGAGRSVEQTGAPQGPWTAELLAAAISEISSNPAGVDLRTVQLWFQDNDKGISNENIRWLARIFGCGDPEAISQWQAALFEAQAQLVAKRRKSNPADQTYQETEGAGDVSANASSLAKITAKAEHSRHSKSVFDLATHTEASFSRRSALELPSITFAGAIALGFTAPLLGVHDVHHTSAGGVSRQVGYLWAPNWTVVTLFLLPIYLFLVADTVQFWREVGTRKSGLQKLKRDAGASEQSSDAEHWRSMVNALSRPLWMNFILCSVFVFFVQWSDYCLTPIINGIEFATIVDWCSVQASSTDSLLRYQTLIFTLAAYLYLGTCVYLYFSGLILLFGITLDLDRKNRNQTPPSVSAFAQSDSVFVLHRVFRCTVVGLMIAIAIKIQQSYLVAEKPNIIDYLKEDFLRVIFASQEIVERPGMDFSVALHFNSIIVVLATCAVFVNAWISLRGSQPKADAKPRDTRELAANQIKSTKVPGSFAMAGTVVFLLVSYASVGSIDGFTVLLAFGLLVSAWMTAKSFS